MEINKLNIIHSISSLDISTGGPARSSTSLINRLLLHSDISSVEMVSLRSLDPYVIKYINDKGKISFFTPTLLDYSTELRRYLNSLKYINIYHGHGIWGLTIHQMAGVARKHNRPYIISVRGMLEPWSLQQSSLKKKIAMFLYQNRDLKEATCLHATASSEAEEIKKLGFNNPIAIIPNGINLPDYPLKDFSIIKEKKKLLFLSRIHPKKGIELLINAWARIDLETKADWEIEIAGNGDTSYVEMLEKLIFSKGLQDQIKIVGPKFGRDKISAYHSADLFVLPTYSENFGIVIAEALACGVPVITTKGTPWKELEEYNAGKWIDIGLESLELELSKLLIKSSEELKQLGINGRKLIEDNYSIDSVAEKFLELYKWVLNTKGNKPTFIV